MSDSVKITWLGHSCFKVEAEGYAVIFDPYEDGYVPGLKPLREEADQVLCSHEHGDHNARKVIAIREGAASPFQVRTISTYHDDRQGALRGANQIHILETGGISIAHAGDLGCELLPEQAQALKGVKVLMVPVGGYYTIDAVQARKLVDTVCPEIVLPMHYRGAGFGFDVLAPLEDYLGLCDDVVAYEGDTLEVTKDLPRQTAVLKLERI